jgi:hypothetical protein
MDIEALEAAKDAAYQQYQEIATRLHAAYWDRLQEQLPSIIETVTARYPGAVISTERTEWTHSDEFFFDHWVRIRLPEPPSMAAENEVYEWLREAVPLSTKPGLSFGVF